MRFGYAFGVRRRNLAWLLAGPASAMMIMSFTDLQPGAPQVTAMAAVAVWMAIWWVTEALPLAATALVPAVMFPVLGILPETKVSAMYFNSTILLFLGGMIIALAMERWNLHKRIALLLIRAIGLSPSRLLLGFMVATAFLSAWVSNTACAMMMLPIALAVINKLEESGGSDPQLRKFEVGLLLAIAYAASIGGMATLVGTPPNLALGEIFHISFPEAPELSFARWAVFATPLSIVLLAAAWGCLHWLFCRRFKGMTHQTGVFIEELKKLGPMGYEEICVAIVFAMTALLWMTRSSIDLGLFVFPGWGDLFTQLSPEGKPLNFVDDGTVAITMAVILFMIPTKRPHRGMLVAANDLKQLPWGILLLFGGGFALAGGFKDTGLSALIGDKLAGLAGLPPVVLVLAVVLVMTLLTNVTSNTASTQMILPVMVTLALAVQLNPLLLMVPAALADSTAFMLPAATPPNAIIFGSDRVSVNQMAGAGLLLSLISAVLVVVAMFTLGDWALGIDLDVMPHWANGAS